MIDKEEFADEFADLAHQAGIEDTCALEFPEYMYERHESSPRSFAEVDPHGLYFAFAPQVLELDWAHRRGLIMHELGHVLCRDLPDGGNERDADKAAEKAFGERIIYDTAWPGKGLQCVCTRKRNPMSITPKIEDEFIDWFFLNHDLMEELEAEGYRWIYFARNAPALDIDHVLITDEFPHGDLVVTKKFLHVLRGRDMGLDIIGRKTMIAATTHWILEYFKDRDEPIELTHTDRDNWVAVVHPCARPSCKWQGSMFDDRGPVGHIESQSQKGAVERLVEDGYTKIEVGALKRVLPALANPAGSSDVRSNPDALPSLPFIGIGGSYRPSVYVFFEIRHEGSGDLYLGRRWIDKSPGRFVKAATSVASQNIEIDPSDPRVQRAQAELDRETRGNPPFSGYDSQYSSRKLPKDPTKISYRRKRDALNVFLDHNGGIIDEAFSGPTAKQPKDSFDNFNHQFGLKGKRQIDNFAKALWLAMPPGVPYYLEDIKVEMLNETSPMVHNTDRYLTIPDYAEEERLLAQEQEYWESKYGDVFPEHDSDDSEAPF